MSEDPAPKAEERGPTELTDPIVRQELKRASVWIGLAVSVYGLFYLAQPLLLIFAGCLAPPAAPRGPVAARCRRGRRAAR